MRFVLSAVLLTAALAWSASACAAPSVSFTVRAEPIPGFAHTGNLLGAGARLSLTVHVAPAPGEAPLPVLTHLALSVPAGMDVRTVGFPRCPDALLASGGPAPAGCAAGAKAGGTGTLSGLVSSGGELQAETFAAQPYFAELGGIAVPFAGEIPVALDGHALFDVTGEPTPSQVELTFPPLRVEGEAVRFTGMQLVLGTAVRSASRTSYMVRMPPTCRAGALPYTLTAGFGGEGLAPEESAVATYRAACSRHRSAATGPPAPVPQCTSRRRVTVHIRRRGTAAYRRVTATLNGSPIAVVRGRELTVLVDLTGKPKGTYVLRVTLETRSRRRSILTRTFHTCTAGASSA